jgi:hypothetical protein
MTKKLIYPFALLLFIAVWALAAAPAVASPQPQVFYQTPTPDADGRIIYTVREGESCTSISLLTQTDINELRLNNNLDANCSLNVGQKLILKIVEVQTPEPTTAPVEGRCRTIAYAFCRHGAYLHFPVRRYQRQRYF